MIGNQYDSRMDAISPQPAAQSSNTNQSRDEPAEEPSDEQLLKRYCSQRDEVAFAVLVHRHGPMVWRVCRRVLGQTHDAEDAFQATFVVLVRKAATVRWQKSIAGWLYQVSHRVALRSRAQAAKRATVAASGNLAAVPVSSADSADEARRGVIEEEISRLPESLRLPVVMCYIEGLTNSQAARRIGCPEGTVVSRLARARSRLRRRLRARGIAVVGAAALAGLLADGAGAAVAPALAGAAIALAARDGATGTAVVSAHVAQFASAVVREIFWQRTVRCGLAILLGTAIVGSIVVVELGLWSVDREPDAAPARGPVFNEMNPAMNGPNPQTKPQIANAMQALQGDWILEDWEFEGQRFPVDPASQNIVFAGDRCILTNVFGQHPGPVMADIVFDNDDPSRFFDLIAVIENVSVRCPCLYEVSEGTLRIAIAFSGRPRPTELTTKNGKANGYYMLMRAEP